MKKYIALLLVSFTPLLSFEHSFQIQQNFVQTPRGRRIAYLVAKEQYGALENMVRNGKISLKHLLSIAQKFPQTPFERATKATKKILRLKVLPAKSFPSIFAISLFAETKLPQYLSKGIFYCNKKKFGYEIEADRSSGRLFIHLPKKKKNLLGIGRMKVVTKTIFYSNTKPEVMAYAHTTHKIQRERYAMKALKGLPNVLSAQGFLCHKDPKTSKKVYGVVTKICNQGSLFQALESGEKFTFKEKLSIAKDLSTGLYMMHSHHFVHRDLGVRNDFLSIKKTAHGRRVHAWIADFGRTIPVKDALDVPVQGNAMFMPPEGIFRKKMVRKDYYQSDLFALGCALWRLYYDKMPSWSEHRFPKKSHWSSDKQYHALVKAIQKEHSRKIKKIKKYTSPVRKKFARLLIKLTSPHPSHRGDTKEAKRTIEKCLRMLY